MESPGPDPEEIFQLCRLCLANNEVNVPIFCEQSDIRQTSLKISSCLPVKIDADDLLPKNICEGCSDKLELLYTFWNSSQEAEKKLKAWVQKIGINHASKTICAIEKQIVSPEVEVKEETEDCHDKIIINQSFDEDVHEKESEEAPPPKRARRSPTVKVELGISHEYDVDEPDPFKVENESDISIAEEDEPHLSFVDVPSTEPQPGPSGEQNYEADAPFPLFEKIEIVEEYIKQEKEEDEVKENAFNEQPDKQKPKMKCDYCDKTYQGGYSPITHKTSHRGSKVCDSCVKTHSQPETFTNHYTNHVRKRKFNCETCNKNFYNIRNLQEHQQIHAFQRKEFICGICGKIFLRKQKLRHHILREINNKCEFCSAVFSKKHLLTVHTKGNHANETKYPCKICGKEYLIKDSLRSHMGSHKMELRCDICNSQYPSRYKLNLHKNVHSREVEYPCDLCRKTFLLLSSLKRHVREQHRNV